MRFISKRNNGFMLNVTDQYCILKEGFPVIRVICHEIAIHVTGHVSQESEAQRLLPCVTRQSETLDPCSGLWQVCPHLCWDNVLQARSGHKMTGGRLSEWPTLNSPPPFGPSVKAYFLVHVRSLHLSTIPFVLVYNFPFVLPLTK